MNGTNAFRSLLCMLFGLFTVPILATQHFSKEYTQLTHHFREK